jgi:hypothetical protein
MRWLEVPRVPDFQLQPPRSGTPGWQLVGWRVACQFAGSIFFIVASVVALVSAFLHAVWPHGVGQRILCCFEAGKQVIAFNNRLHNAGLACGERISGGRALARAAYVVDRLQSRAVGEA